MNFKQKLLHLALSFRDASGLFTTLCGFCICATPAFSQMMTGDIGKDAATLRLVAAPGLKNGAYIVGIEIVMTPGSHTYWKLPGEAGVPPVFSFNDSQNVRSAIVLFPTPTRLVEEGLEAFGYGDRVVFPVIVTPQDSKKPSELHADVAYAVCNKICIPAHDAAVLPLPAGANDDGGEIVARALAAVPVDMPAVEQAALQTRPDPASSKPSWTLTWTGSQPLNDIFANAPEGFYFATRRAGPQTWRLTADEVLAAPKATKVPVELTLSRNDSGFVTTETLDVSTAAK